MFLQGYRNKQDLLWDIPILNIPLMSNNITPSNNSDLYAFTIKKDQKEHTPIQQTRKRKILPPYTNVFKAFDDIIELNDCVNAINEIKKKDRTSNTTHKLGVII